MGEKIMNIYRRMGADAVVMLWLGVWWVCNLFQAGCSELANDEAYYWMFAENLAWGYFDHPPFTALLVWLGGLFSRGELGVRLFFTLLQPLYLYLFWTLIRPREASRRDAQLYCVITAATLMLQLYGFIAVPDGPLMMTAALFLVAFKWFLERRAWSWLGLGVAMALMAYAKYHGALVVLFCLAANPKAFLRPQLYLAGLVTGVLLVPHLMWQYDHDWASFVYHLSARNSQFKPGYVTDFVANMLVVFNPLYVPLYVQAWRKTRPQDGFFRALKLLPVAFIGFFLMSAFRGYVQPQWVIVAVFGLVYLLFDYARRHTRTRRYVMRAGGVVILLLVVVRLEMVFNPLGLRFEVFDNPESYGRIARIADGRPVIFRDHYALAAKYRFYTGGETFCQPNVYYRTHQWQFRDDDRRFAGREAVIVTSHSSLGDSTLHARSEVLANGREFVWLTDPCFTPVREVDIRFEGMPDRVRRGERLTLDVTFDNPYDHAVEVGREVKAVMTWKRGRFYVVETPVEMSLVVAPHESRRLKVEVTVPDDLETGEGFDAGFALTRRGYVNWFNGKTHRVEVL